MELERNKIIVYKYFKQTKYYERNKQNIHLLIGKVVF